MMLSILVPCITDRITMLRSTLTDYENFIDKYQLRNFVEIVSIIDNKERSVGQKRNDHVSIAQGDYLVISDDDDFLKEVYFDTIKGACERNVDVITYFQMARINHEFSIVDFRHNNENQFFVKNGITKRRAWHCCTWRREVVKDIKFPLINWGEDEPWSIEANQAAKTSFHIDEVCHIYEHDSHLTASFQ